MSAGRPKPPGEFIRLELEARGWAQADLARIINRPFQAINEIIQGKKAVTPETAVALGIAFETGPEIWMNRENAYRLSLVESHDPGIQRRARLYDLAPVKDMEKRGWIKATDKAEGLERELCRFFDVDSLDDTPQISAVARKTSGAVALSPTQRAWCFRAKNLAHTVKAGSFEKRQFDAGCSELRKLVAHAEQARHVPRVLAELGVRLVVLEPLPRSRIDGATFWIADDAPVIALSLRYDRIDCFWHTLAHEISHVRHRDEYSVDSDIVGEGRGIQFDAAGIEARADQEAASMLIQPDKLKSFILRIKPLYSKQRIIQFALRMRVHPGIVTGQLQHLGEISYGTNREMLVKVRDTLINAALTDGWGRVLPAM
jgi:HTH-type transcriptional regulator/antitoxin HigA